jgi:hypothetical protein
MRNRLFAVRPGKSDKLNRSRSNDWDSLRGKFSGERLFKYRYFDIICGDLSSITTAKNRWFIENILKAGSEGDINLLSGIKKIVTDTSLDEGLRQRASEISENLEEINSSFSGAKSADLTEEKKVLSARQLLNAVRIPQTAEILRLLKDRSPELRRSGLFIVGKFRITSLIPEVCESLIVNGLEEDAVSVLSLFGTEAENELLKCYFKYSGNINVSANILRILAGNNSSTSSSFIFEMLWAAPRQVREMALEILLGRQYEISREQRKRLNLLLYEAAGVITDIISSITVLRKNNKDYLVEVLKKEYYRWTRFFSGANSLLNLSDNNANQNEEQNTENYDLGKQINSIANIILSEKRNFNDILKGKSDIMRKLKRLHNYFPVRIEGYNNVCEKILNYSYNNISIWTKACILRDLKSVRESDIEDSVIALLFGNDEILQEEAARLLALSNLKDYGSVLQRIPEKTKLKLMTITSPGFDKEDLLYEKTLFLSNLFGTIPEDELITLACGMKYFRKNMVPDSENKCIIWFLSNSRPDQIVIVLNNGKTFDKSINEKNDGLYLLSLGAVEKFHNHFPEHVFEIMKYIDENE